MYQLTSCKCIRFAWCLIVTNCTLAARHEQRVSHWKAAVFTRDLAKPEAWWQSQQFNNGDLRPHLKLYGVFFWREGLVNPVAMEDLQLCLPAEEETVEVPHQSRTVHPGHLWSEDLREASESSEAPNLVWQCHLELVKKLDRHEKLLQQLLNRKLTVPSEASSVVSVHSRTSNVSGHSRMKHALRSPRSVDSQEAVHTVSGNSHRLQNSSPNLFQSFTAFDLGLKADAQAAHTETSRRKYASLRMDQVLGASVLSSKEAIQKVQRVVLHPAFDIFFALVVFTNAIFIGLEAQSNMSGNWLPPSTIRIVNYSYAVAFTLELLGRIIAGGCSFFYSEDCMWNYLDVCIVITSIIEIVFDLISEAQGAGQHITGFKVFRIIRLSKVVKTVRLVRIVRFVLALRTLVTSIAHTLKALFWALTLLALIIYVFAILFAQAVHDASLDPDKAAEAIGEKYFRSLPEIMLTLFMSIAGGVSWEDVIYPLIEIDAMWAFFFLFFVAFTYFAVLNVVTGVFCQSAIENAQKDQAAVVQNILDNKESRLKKIRYLFTQLGADNTGAITYEMLNLHMRTPAVRIYFESLGLDVTDAWSFFKLLDSDGGGAVEVEEFLLGCLRLRGQEELQGLNNKVAALTQIFRGKD
eukprot:s886_g2.t1